MAVYLAPCRFIPFAAPVGIRAGLTTPDVEEMEHLFLLVPSLSSPYPYLDPYSLSLLLTSLSSHSVITISRAQERRLFDMGKFVIRRVYPGLKRGDRRERGLGTLGAFDHSTLDPGFVIPMHPHRNDEILSYMRRGTMYHRDSEGIRMPIHAHNMMMMNAGREIFHEETLPADADPVDMLQVFFRPRKDDLEPQVQFATFEETFSKNAWRLIGGPEDSSAPLKVRSASWLYDVYLDRSSIETPELDGRTGYLYVFDGEVKLPRQSETLRRGDGALVEGERVLAETDDVAELVYFMVDEKAPYTRSGMYSG